MLRRLATAACQASTSASLPTTTLALVYGRHAAGGAALALETVPLPQLGPGDVLVRMLAAPVNPADLNQLEVCAG